MTPLLSPAQFQSFLQYLLQLFTNPLVLILLGVPLLFILIDLVTGVVSALSNKRFQAKQLSSFLSNDIARYLASFVLITLLSLISWATSGIVTAQVFCGALSAFGMGALCISVTTSIIENLREITDELPAPLEVEASHVLDDIQKRLMNVEQAYVRLLTQGSSSLPSTKTNMSGEKVLSALLSNQSLLPPQPTPSESEKQPTSTPPPSTPTPSAQAGSSFHNMARMATNAVLETEEMPSIARERSIMNNATMQMPAISPTAFPYPLNTTATAAPAPFHPVSVFPTQPHMPVILPEKKEG